MQPVRQQPYGLTIGRMLDFKASGQRLQRWVIITEMDDWGLQIAIRDDGKQWRHVMSAYIYPHHARKGSGMYEAKTDRPLTPDQVELIKRKRIEFGLNQNPLIVDDLNGQPIRIDKPDEAIKLTREFAAINPATADPILSGFYLSRSQYWQHLHDTIQATFSNHPNGN